MPLSKLSGLWTAIIFLAYSDFNDEFDIHIYAKIFQLGAVISQKYKLISFYSRKLTDYQKNYTVIEKELLKIL